MQIRIMCDKPPLFLYIILYLLNENWYGRYFFADYGSGKIWIFYQMMIRNSNETEVAECHKKHLLYEFRAISILALPNHRKMKSEKNNTKKLS